MKKTIKHKHKHKSKSKYNTRNKKTTKNKKRNNTHKNVLLGGKVIGSGGFGCVFDPPLKCINSKSTHHAQNNIVSKIMMLKYAKSEYEVIKSFEQYLKYIPNYKTYFAIGDITICQPDEIPKKQLTNFSKCTALTKKNITSSNINKHLNKLKILNMTNYGNAINTLYDNHISLSELEIINSSLIKLYTHGIINMNKKHIYHADIKAANILIDKKHTSRLIDWGLSYRWKENMLFPEKAKRRPFQFNTPFSSILFNEMFITKLDKLHTIHSTPTYDHYHEFIIDYVEEYINKGGGGHISSMNNIYKQIFNQSYKKSLPKTLSKYPYACNVILPYLTNIMVKFVKNKSFMTDMFFKYVYLKNIDAWGFLSTYFTILDYTTNQTVIYNIQQLIDYMVKSSTEPMSSDKIIKMLKKLTTK